MDFNTIHSSAKAAASGASKASNVSVQFLIDSFDSIVVALDVADYLTSEERQTLDGHFQNQQKVGRIVSSFCSRMLSMSATRNKIGALPAHILTVPQAPGSSVTSVNNK